MQSKEDLRLVLTELKKQQQELDFDVHAGLQEKQTQLTNYIKLLQKAEGLMFLLNELKSQGDYLRDCIGDSCFMEESRIELKYLHESLLSQLQVGIMPYFLIILLVLIYLIIYSSHYLLVISLSYQIRMLW